MDIKVFLGKRIKTIREERNILQKDLAEAIGITKQSLSAFEKGTHSPSLETLLKIADNFSVSIDYLLGRTNIPDINK